MSLKNPPSPLYDAITSDELFDSFMDVALAAEKEDLCTVSNPETSVAVAEQQEEVLMPLPLLLKQGESLYETIATAENSSNDEGTVLEYVVLSKDKVDTETSEETCSNTIVTVTASPIKKSPLPDYPGAINDVKSKGNLEDQTVVKNNQPDLNDLYAVVDKSQKNKKCIVTDVETIEITSNGGYAKIGKKTQSDSNEQNHDLYAVVDKTHKVDNGSKSNSDSSNDDYESIISVSKSLHDITSKNKEGDYAVVDYVIDEKNNSEIVNLDYQSVSDLKLEKRINLRPEDIAFGLRRFQTEGQADLYKSCLNTIERGAQLTSVEKKKSFFNFGRTKSVDKMSDEKKPGLTRRHSNIPSMCTGYLFKQGGTGITPKNWRLRWFELKKDNCLYYYKNEQDPTPAGAVMLTKYTVTRAVEANKRFSFKLAKGGARTYYFAANSEEEMKKWMKNLVEAVSIANSDPTSIPECSLKNVSVPATSISEPDCHGFLWKQGNFHKSWRRRYCVLKYGCLFYYEDMADQVAIGVFKLNNYVISDNDMGEESKHGFKAVAPARKMRSYFFYAESEIDCRRWIEAMKHSVATRTHQT